METSLAKQLGSRIKELRTAKGLKQSEIADKLDMERSNYTRIENGKQAPSHKNLEKIAHILNVDIKDLFDFEHIQDKAEIICEIDKLLTELSEKELKYIYKSIKNLKLIH